ncbi:MAG: cytochrome P450 [Candidatus Limnocylindrales bacterium]|jgi:cytochrome P450
MARPSFDALLTDARFAQDPSAAYRLLSEQEPVYWSDAWGAWLVTRYDDVVATLRDHERFSSKGRLVELIDALPAAARAEAGPLREHFSTSGLIHTDPPDHTRMRGLIKKAFSPRVIAAMEPRIQRIVDRLLDEVDPAGGFDVVSDLAYPLPATVIAELLGARPEDRDRFKSWSDGIVAFQGQGRAIPEAVPTSAEAVTAMRTYIGELMAERRQDHHDDLLGQLVSVEEAGEQLTTDEIYSTCVTFLIGGHETTTSLIANCLYRLLMDPEQLARARADEEALAGAIEESLRFDSPIQRTFRRVSETTSFGGHELRKDQIVIQLLGAANRDPGHFDRPDDFDVRRKPNRHIAFGSGVHFCIGAPLARLEAKTALRTILERMPTIALAVDDVAWQDEKALFRCVRSLPVRAGGQRR